MTYKTTLAATATAAALALAPMAPAFAQADAPPGGEAQTAVPDALLDSFVVAALDVSAIAQDYEAQIEAAASDDARQSLALEAQEAMVAAVEEAEGITVDEYVAISQAARVDESLNRRVMDRIAGQAPAQ